MVYPQHDRIRQGGGQQCRLMSIQLLCGDAEIVPAGRFHAKQMIAEFGDVQIYQQNPVLGPQCFN